MIWTAEHTLMLFVERAQVERQQARCAGPPWWHPQQGPTLSRSAALAGSMIMSRAADSLCGRCTTNSVGCTTNFILRATEHEPVDISGPH